jgi:hypothetical protein
MLVGSGVERATIPIMKYSAYIQIAELVMSMIDIETDIETGSDQKNTPVGMTLHWYEEGNLCSLLRHQRSTINASPPNL